VIAGLLLAAGRSRRFGAGGDKLLALLRGRPVIQWSAESIAGAVDVLYVVTPPGAHELVRALEDVEIVLVEHVGRDGGLGTSIGAGIAALDDEVDAVLVALADQPLVDRALVSTLCEAWRAREGTVRAVAPVYRDGRGHPVVFSRSCFDELSALHGDSGARALLDAMAASAELLLVAVDADAPRDVDTPEMLAALERGSSVAR
jgi:molybdenum cofactor cytidylyltransferase